MVTRFKFWFALKDCLFGGVKLRKNADPDKYVYIGYGIRFDSRSESSLPDDSMGKNVIIFRVRYEPICAFWQFEKKIS